MPHKIIPQCVSLLLILCLLSAPAASALTPKGQKNYKQGLEFEAAQQWEKAAGEFALAVSADPSNTEYQLHYRRSVFNASQVFMQQGATLYERRDYVGAYNAFRRAYDYDQANELAHSMMERSLQRQLKTSPSLDDNSTENKPSGETKITPTAYAQESSNNSATPPPNEDSPLNATRTEQLRVITFSGDLENFIKYLARQIRLNVIFDRDFPKRNVNVDLQEVTAAQALDYIFLTQGLFFQKLTSRTILVADQTKRPQYQQLVLRTFYLFNVDPNDARLLIQAALPPQAGRQPVITPNKSTNSITVRDTPENVRLVGDILKNIDKERAEVVMDVNIYEVSRTDLLQLGNQLGTDASLQNLGGIQKGLNILGGSRETLLKGAAALAGPTALGAALMIPSSTLSALQRRDNTRLIASTQVHAFDGEKSTAHIGQRVPVQTASVSSFGSGSAADGNPQPGVAPGLFGGNGYPVIQYEKTGLTLEFTPQVFPDLDVQVKMSIKSNDVANTGGTTLTPTFTERNIEGTARIQNNRTMMIASVAQNQQSRGRQGLPVLGLVPIFGRLFTAPRRNDSQTDIVIAVTPHVMRAPAVTAHDEEVHPSGTLQNPNSDTLEAVLQEVSREEQIAAARLIPKVSNVQLPDAETPGYVPAPKALMNNVRMPAQSDGLTSNAVLTQPNADLSQPAANTSLAPASETPAAPSPSQAAATEAVRARYAQPIKYAPPVESRATNAEVNALPRSAAELRLLADSREMRVGERRQLKLLLKTDAPLALVALSCRFNPQALAVRSVTQGSLTAGEQGTAVTLKQMISPEGLLLVSVTPSTVRSITGAGVLLVVEVEALAEGASALSFNADDVHLLATDGRKILLKTTGGQISMKQ
ncbi:MAG: hypothetical protein LC754_02560 [Acidobacteria bacterium]|nr:hypothetical protein [Acidobacteriota bacterium]